MQGNITLRRIVANGAVAAVYFLLTFLSPISFGLINIRVAEILVLLCFFRRDYAFGVTVGCILSNLVSKLGPWDILIGGGATLLSCLAIGYLSPRLWVACIWNICINAVLVGFELWLVLGFPFIEAILAIALGELISMGVGYLLFRLFKKRQKVFEYLGANRHLDWVC